MDSLSPKKDKGPLVLKGVPEKGSSFIRNVPHVMILREYGSSRYQNQLAPELQIAAEQQLTRKQFKETASIAPKCQLPDVTRSTYLVVFSPDGKKMASSHGNHNVYVTDVKTGKNLNTLSGHPRTPWCIAFHPSSNQILASGCLGGQVRVWDLHGGSEIWTVEGQTSIASLAFHPTDRLLVVASYNEILFWDWSQPEPFAKCCTQNEKEKIRYVAFNLAGTKLITGIENPQPLQSQWDRVGPIHYVPHSGSPRGPRPVGPRPGFGSVFSHSGPGPSPAPHPITGHFHPSNFQRLITSHDERGRITWHLTPAFPEQVSRPTQTTASFLERRNAARRGMLHQQTSRTPPSATATSADEHPTSNQNNGTGLGGPDLQDNADHSQSWMWRSQHTLGEGASPQSLTSNRFRLWPMLGRRNSEFGRLRSASRNHRRHLQILLDQCRRSRAGHSSSHMPQASASSTSLSSTADDRPNGSPVSHSSLSTSEPVSSQLSQATVMVENPSYSSQFHPNEESNEGIEINTSALSGGYRSGSSSHVPAIPGQRSHVVQQISFLSEDVERVLRVLQEHISSMQLCPHCQPRMDSFRLNHICQLWAEIQGQIRSLQVSLWENAGLASNAWHRLSFEAITEMLSHMSHQDRLEDRLSSSTEAVNVSSEHIRNRNLNSALSSSSDVADEASTSTLSSSGANMSSSNVSSSEGMNSAYGRPPVDIADETTSACERPQSSPISTLPLPFSQNADYLTVNLSSLGNADNVTPASILPISPSRLTESSLHSLCNSDSLQSNMQASSAMSTSLSPPSVPRTEPVIASERERESLHITWVDQSARGSTAVGVVSRRDAPNSGDSSSSSTPENNSLRGSTLRGRLFRARRQNMFANTSLESSDVSRVHRSLPIRTSRLSTEGFRVSSEAQSHQSLSSRSLDGHGTLPVRRENQPSLHPNETLNSLTEREGTETNSRPLSSSYLTSRAGVRRLSDHVSMLRWLRKPRMSAWRVPRLRSSSQAVHNPSRNYGSRRAVLEVTVDASSLDSQQQPTTSTSRTEGMERTSHNMLMRIFRSLRRDRLANSGSGLQSAQEHISRAPLIRGNSSPTPNVSTTSHGSNSYHDPLISADLPSLTSTRQHLSNFDQSSSPWTRYSPNGDVPRASRTRSRSSSLNSVEGELTSEEWAHRLYLLRVQQQFRERHTPHFRARLNSRYSAEGTRGLDCLRGGPCFCGGCICTSSGSRLNQSREGIRGRRAASQTAVRSTHDSTTTEQSASSSSSCFQEDSVNNTQGSNQHGSSRPESTSTVAALNGSLHSPAIEPERSIETIPLSNAISSHSSHTPEVSSLGQQADFNNVVASSSETVTTSGGSAAVACSQLGSLDALPNECKTSKLESNRLSKAGSSSSFRSALHASSKSQKSSKGKEAKNNSSSKRRTFHQTNNKRRTSSLRAIFRRASREPRTNQHQEGLNASTSQPNHSGLSMNSEQSSSRIPSQLPEPNFSRQLENILGRMEQLIILQRSAFNSSSGEPSRPFLRSSPPRNTGDGAYTNGESSGLPDAISITSRLLTRLTQSLVNQLLIVQQAHERHNCFENRYHHFSSRGSPPSSYTRPPMMSDTRQRAEELMDVMMDNLATFSRESSLGDTSTDNAVSEHIQTMSVGLYMSLHLALELTDVLLSHIIASYESSDPQDPRAPLSQPCVCPTASSSSPSWMQVRSAFVPPQSWSHSSRSTSSSSASSVADVNTPSSSSQSQSNESRISSRMRLLNHASPCNLSSPYNNQTSANSTSMPNGVSNPLVSRVFTNGLCPNESPHSIENDSSNHSAASTASLQCSQSARSSSNVRLSVPTVQVNDVPLSEINEWPSPSSTLTSSQDTPRGSHESETSSSPNVRWTSSPASSQPSHSAEGGRPGPFRVRPRLLHPHYSRYYSQDPFISSDGDYSAQSLLFQFDYSRSGGSFVREPFFSSEEHRIHRIQLWDFSEGLIPDISKADKNVVVSECKIHNDASVDVSAEGHLLVALLPITRTVLHPHLTATVGQAVGVYSLAWESLGQLLYTTSLDQAAVSVALSPTAAYLLVGLVSRRTVLVPNDRHALAQIFRLEGARPGRPVGARGRLNLHRDIELQRDHVASSLNCIRWAPMPGQGFVYGTNTGALVMLR